jgi:hypothetical protein
MLRTDGEGLQHEHVERALKEGQRGLTRQRPLSPEMLRGE